MQLMRLDQQGQTAGVPLEKMFSFQSPLMTKTRETLVRSLSTLERKKDSEGAKAYLSQLCNSENKNIDIKEIEAFCAAAWRTDTLFQSLSDALFARKCTQYLPGLQVCDLVDADGKPTSCLLDLLKKNFLHRVIAKANENDKGSAFLVEKEGVFIRSKEGCSFLEESKKVGYILRRIGAAHRDREYLEELFQLLARKESGFVTQAEEARIEELKKNLTRGSYLYLPIEEIKRNEKGLLVNQAFLADGLEPFHSSLWKELRPAFRVAASEPKYYLRVITRQPPYALEKNWMGVLWSFFRNLLDFRAHGHAWIEISQARFDPKGAFMGEEDIYNVGYYFHPLDRYKRLECPDPMAYRSIDPQLLTVREVILSKEQFSKAHLYLNELQKMFLNPKRSLLDKPQTPGLSKEQKKEIQHLYKTTLKSSCICFANTLNELITGQVRDDRSPFRQWFFSKNMQRVSNCFDCIIERSALLRLIVYVPRLFWRMELPLWEREGPPAQSPRFLKTPSRIKNGRVT